MQTLKEWFRANLTRSAITIWGTLNAKLAGHYQYYNVNDNWQMCTKYREAARRLAFRWFRRRGDTRKLNWDEFNAYLKRYPLVTPGTIVDLIAMARSSA